MTDYSELSDFEINWRVEMLTGMYCEDMNGQYRPTCDYCNDPSDAWPIIEEIWDELNRLCEIDELETWWQRVIKDSECSPLRAAMIIYLMDKETEA